MTVQNPEAGAPPAAATPPPATPGTLPPPPAPAAPAAPPAAPAAPAPVGTPPASRTRRRNRDDDQGGRGRARDHQEDPDEEDPDDEGPDTPLGPAGERAFRRTQERLRAVEARLAASDAQAARSTAILELNVPEQFRPMVTGGTLDEARASAKAITDALAAHTAAVQATPPPPPPPPIPSFDGGPRPQGEPQDLGAMDPASYHAARQARLNPSR